MATRKVTKATTKATATTKTTTKEVASEPIKETAKEVRKFNPNDLIPCSNAFAGTTILVGSKTGIVYTWEGLGYIQEVEYRDLLPEVSRRSSSYIYEPLIIVEDEDFLDSRPDLKKFYENLYTLEDLKDIILKSSASKLKQIVKGLPKSNQKAIGNLAASMIADGTLDSIKKINVLDEVLGTKLMMQTDLYSD